MGKYISFGNINPNYKYILLYIISHLLIKLLLSKKNLRKLGEFDITLLNHKLINKIFNYSGLFIISIFLFLYENYQKKRSLNKANVLLQKNVTTNIKLIYIDQLEGRISLIRILIIIFLVFLQNELMSAFSSCGLEGLDFWPFEILFLYFIYSRILSTSLYRHQKCSVIFVVISSTLFKIFATITLYLNRKELIYKTYKILIPIGIILYLLFSYLRAYSITKMKWLMDLKYISSSELLMIFGLMGAIICSIACSITTTVPCTDKLIKYEEMIYICKQTKTVLDNNNKNVTYHYYDNFSIYFEKYKGITYICLEIVAVIFKFIKIFSSIQIIKYLNPFFFICASSIYYFFYRPIDIIISFINKEKIDEDIYFNFVAESFAILGILVYTELIVLNFCNLNYNIKSNIEKRSLEDTHNIELIGDENDNKNDDDSFNQII